MKKALLILTVCIFVVTGLFWGLFAQEKKDLLRSLRSKSVR